MTIEEVVRQVLREEHGEVIRESVRAVAQELMEAEVSELIGAHAASQEERATHRNGYRPRPVSSPKSPGPRGVRAALCRRRPRRLPPSEPDLIPGPSPG